MFALKLKAREEALRFHQTLSALLRWYWQGNKMKGEEQVFRQIPYGTGQQNLSISEADDM